MNKSDWKSVAELVGIAAIVVSLVFVGLQLRQSHEIAIASQYHQRAAMAIDNFNAELESGRMLPMFARANGYSETSGERMEQFAAESLWRSKYLLLMDNNYYQYQSGFVEEPSWQAHRTSLKWALGRDSRLRDRVFSPNAMVFRQPFVDLCIELVAEYEAENRDR